MIKNGYKRRYFWGRKSPSGEETDLGLCSFGSKLHPQVVDSSRVMAFPEHGSFQKQLFFCPSKSPLLSLLGCLCIHLLSCPLHSLQVRFMFCHWMISRPACVLYHVIRQQLMQRGPSLLFRAPFFLLGAKIAMMASSNTVFRPFWVSAEHST